MLLPVLSTAREKARRINCTSNLKQIGLSMLMYANDEDGNFPTDGHYGGQLAEAEHNFEILIEKSYLQENTKIFGCPSNDVVGSGPEDTNYFYFCGLKDSQDDAATTSLAGDQDANGYEFATSNPEINHTGTYVNMLYVDGHVEGNGN
ncbi:MAG: DUF1559 domain-containing protein [Lentisphaeria bacterium]|nr:DUF1559 domain-containing protein [Lentisphaeria bacterium]